VNATIEKQKAYMTDAEKIVRQLSGVELPNVFNPYRDVCSIHDTRTSPARRRQNLVSQLEAALVGNVDTIWFGRDLGYRGGRRTGVALTDEAHLPLLASRCSSDLIVRATKGPVVAERTANVIWQMLSELTTLPFLWNAFPFHPHEPGDPMSNRCHSKKELAAIWSLNLRLLEILQPTRVLAIGNDAFAALSQLGLRCEYVRHPSYGGQTDFLRGIRRIYNLPEPHRASSNQHQKELELA